MAITWQVLFDWDDDGDFESDEAGYTTALRIDRGRSDPFTAVEAGKAVITLDNSTRRFDPWYIAGALYPNVLPRRAVLLAADYDGVESELAVSATDDLAISASDDLSVASYILFRGRIEEIEPTGHLGMRQVVITAYDGLRDLAQVDVPAIAVLEATEAGAAIAAVLDAVGWDAALRDLETSSDTMAYWWTVAGQNAKAICDSLAESEYGAFFISADGEATFVNRASYLGGDLEGTIDQSDIADILIASPWSQIYNVIQLVAHPIAAQALADLWQLQDIPQILAGATLTVWGHYEDANGRACAADDVVSPVATTDYTANAQADGGGANMTANLTVTASIYGTEAKFVLTNTHATDTLYVTLLKIRGKALVVTPVSLREDDTASQTTYGKRLLMLEMPHRQDLATAVDLADNLVALLAEPAPVVTVVLDHLLPDMFNYDLMDIIRLTTTEYSIAADFRLERIALTTGATMQYVKAEWLLQPTRVTTLGWLLGTAGRSELGTTTYMGW